MTFSVLCVTNYMFLFVYIIWNRCSVYIIILWLTASVASDLFILNHATDRTTSTDCVTFSVLCVTNYMFLFVHIIWNRCSVYIIILWLTASVASDLFILNHATDRTTSTDCVTFSVLCVTNYMFLFVHIVWNRCSVYIVILWLTASVASDLFYCRCMDEHRSVVQVLPSAEVRIGKPADVSPVKHTWFLLKLMPGTEFEACFLTHC